MRAPTLTPLRLRADEWRDRAAAHAERADALTAGHRSRRRKHESHPIEDFLFTYYSVAPNELRRWHPGAGVVLENAAEERGGWRYYTETGAENADASVDADAYFTRRGGTVDFVERLLAQTLERPAFFGCFGLHEWAMVYRLRPEEVRHTGVPLRLGAAETDRVVESHRITCTHFDAYRFFTPDAAFLNQLRPTRRSQPELEQSGCLHAGMDVYKWATKLGPLIPGELLLDAFVFAREAREIDMRASPYDVSGYVGAEGEQLTPIRIETAAGKRAYADLQHRLRERGDALRRRVLQAIADARNAVR